MTDASCTLPFGVLLMSAMTFIVIPSILPSAYRCVSDGACHVSQRQNSRPHTVDCGEPEAWCALRRAFDPISELTQPFSLRDDDVFVPLLWPGLLWIAASVDPQRLPTASLFRQLFPLCGNDAVSRLPAASCTNQMKNAAKWAVPRGPADVDEPSTPSVNAHYHSRSATMMWT